MTIQLTKYSERGGCGCKIPPLYLKNILGSINKNSNPNNIVDFRFSDDAAIYKQNNKTAIISTNDFITPIVDDPYTFGQVVASHSLSDIYAMGGNPFSALSILGWPIDVLSSDHAKKILEGCIKKCAEAEVILAGGHSINILEPFFGLSVSGMIEIDNIKRNNTAIENCVLFLTKPIGTGILATANKKGILDKEHKDDYVIGMLELNTIGHILAKYDFVKAITDISGFGLIGHLMEVCNASNISTCINFENIPLYKGTQEYAEKGITTMNTQKNWLFSENQILGKVTEYKKNILADPQTSGGLLIFIDEKYIIEFEKILTKNKCVATLIGRTKKLNSIKPNIEIL